MSQRSVHFWDNRSTMSPKSPMSSMSPAPGRTHEEHRVRNLMLALSPDAHVVQPPNVRDDVDDELGVGLVGVEVDHVAERTVGQGGAKHGDVVLSETSAQLPGRRMASTVGVDTWTGRMTGGRSPGYGYEVWFDEVSDKQDKPDWTRFDPLRPSSTHLVAPVVHALLVINLLSQPMDHLARRPPHLFLAFLLRHHLVQDGHHPILKRAVIRVWDKQVADPIETGLSVQPRLHLGFALLACGFSFSFSPFAPELRPVKMEIT
jgi:hypothetical protein